MGEPDYEYRGLMAQAWDLLRGDTSAWPDRAFFLGLVERSGAPVLDVGCGTGRLLLDYMAQGIDIDGVDNSPEMLELCRAAADRRGLAPRLYEQQLERLDLPRTYRTILVPSSTIQLITDPAAADEAMRRLYAHLAHGGYLAAPFMTLWTPGEPLATTWEQSAVRPEDGATIRRIASSRYEPESECEHTEDVYQVIVDGAVVAEERHSRSPATRSYTQEQAQALFARAGLANVVAYRAFSAEPPTPDDTLFTLVGERT